MSQSYEPISVLIPIKNGLQYLDQFKNTINSNLRDFDEIIAVNDGSTDSTSDFLDNWKASSSNLKVVQTNGIGLVSSLNLGLKHSSHKWIARFDIDDGYENNRIRIQRELIKSDTTAIFSDYDFIDELGKKYGLLTSPILPSPTAISLINSVRTPHPGVLFNKEAVINVGGYREEDFPAEDLSLWLRLAKVGKIISAPSCLLHYRIRKGSISSSKRAQALQKKDEVLKNISIQEHDFIYCLENLKEIFEIYEKYEKSEQRKILLIRDLLATNRFLGDNQKNKLKIISYGIALARDSANIKELFVLNHEKKKRYKLRQSFNN
jgi:glycosyltransferase involved in cell wall biosynthesis